jgi:FAD/FMN-containing dehydrogenase
MHPSLVKRGLRVAGLGVGLGSGPVTQAARELEARGADLDHGVRRDVLDYHEALHPYSAGGAYVNMMMDEGQERVRAAYGDNYDRLAGIKATYDPDNLFRVNQNIQPART